MITAKQMRALERYALSRGVLPIELMENAGKGVVQEVKKRYILDGKRIVVFCGQGNNGGDGFVTARHFAEDCAVVVLFFGDVHKLSEESRNNYERIKGSITIVPVNGKSDLEKFRFQDNHALLLVDALLGIGLQGELREPVSSAIDYFNRLPGLKVAVDIPSGMDADTGEIREKCCPVDLIVTFHDMKVGLQTLTEKTVVVDIGIPGKG